MLLRLCTTSIMDGNSYKCYIYNSYEIILCCLGGAQDHIHIFIDRDGK